MLMRMRLLSLAAHNKDKVTSDTEGVETASLDAQVASATNGQTARL